MTDERDSILLTLFSFFQPLLSTGAFVLFFHDIYRDEFLFSGAYPLFHILLLLGGVVFFRPFCRKNLYVFEDLETAVTERILLAISLASLAAALVSASLNPRLFLLSIPLGITLFLAYGISLFHSFRFNRIGGIVRLAQRHIRMVGTFLFYLTAGKVLFILIAILLEFPAVHLPLAILGFVFDLILLLMLRAYLNRLDIQKEGFNRRKLYYGSSGLLFFFSLAVASAAARNRSLLSPGLLKRLYLWLISLTSHIPLRSGSVEQEPGGGGPTSEELSGMHSYWESRAADFEFLRKIFDIIEYVMIGFIALLIIYYIFYPVFAPLFFRKRKPMTFREYYASLISALRRFVNRIRQFPKSILKDDMKKRNHEIADDGSSLAVLLSAVAPGPAKRAEVRTLYKLYGRLRKKGDRHLGPGAGSNLPVGDFFSLLSRRKEECASLCSELAPIFNKSFFSPRHLSRDEWKVLRKLSSDLLKGL